MRKYLGCLLTITLCLIGCTAEPELIEVTRIVEVTPEAPIEATPIATTSILDEVRTRGRLNCGMRDNLLGFGYQTGDNEYAGFDIDLCRAVAAAVLGNREAVNFIPLNAAERSIVLQTRQVDILSRNVTWTSSREVDWGNFTNVMFYDGQGFMVHNHGNIKRISDLDGRPICVTTGTTTEANLINAFRERGLELNMILFEDVEAIYGTYEQGSCVAVTSDKSQLLSIRSGFENPEAHAILDAIISKEPLTPAVPAGDDEWLDIVRIVMYILINAEELGIDSTNVEEMRQSENIAIRRLLGTEQSFGQETLRLNQDFAVDIISQVGNYGEIYDRYFGPDGEAFLLPRGINHLAQDGGLIYAPPLK